MNKTLLIMAAGMGSRFGGGGAKQVASLGPNGEMLMEYSIYDAKLAGFDKFVFIISHAMTEFFPELITSKIGSENVYFAEQSFDLLPDWFAVSPDRTKPFGTASAVLAARELINEPFAVINADDFYGRKAFVDLASALDKLAETGEACMLTYRLASTLSMSGGVTRGICKVDENNVLLGINETKGILLTDKEKETICVHNDDGSLRTLSPDLQASMNIFGFTPWMMSIMAEHFENFLREIAPKDANTAECPIPVLLDELIRLKELTLYTVATDSQWFGVTYQEDVDEVKESLKAIADDYR